MRSLDTWRKWFSIVHALPICLTTSKGIHDPGGWRELGGMVSRKTEALLERVDEWGKGEILTISGKLYSTRHVFVIEKMVQIHSVKPIE